MGTRVGFIKSLPSLYSCLLHCIVAIMSNNTIDYKYFFVLSGSAKVTSWTVWQRNRRRRRRKRRRSWRSSWRYFTKINKWMNKNCPTTNFIAWPEASVFSAFFQPRNPCILLQNQSQLVWGIKDKLKKFCSTNDMKELLIANGQEVPSGESNVRILVLSVCSQINSFSPDWEIQHVIWGI